jgi:DNA processing protein
MGAQAHIKAALHLATAGGFGPQAFGALAHLGTPLQMLQASPLVVAPLLRARTQLEAWTAAKGAFERGEDGRIARSLELVQRHGVWVRGEADYPQVLRDIPDPPMVVLHAGKELLEALAQPCVAIVGPRRPNAYGLAVTRKLVHALVAHGVTVVSGAAEGVDSEAHDAALNAGGRTVAVLGVTMGTTDGDVAMRDRMLARGGVLTETLPEVPQHSGSFVQRNRILTALCSVVVVVQGDQKSGTLHTAEFARTQGRMLMGVPGQVTDPLSFVPHKLIGEGARAVWHVEDVLAAIGVRASQVQPGAAPVDTVSAPVPPPADLSDEQARLLAALKSGPPVDIEDVVEETGLRASDVSRLLLELELMGLCKRAPGGAYARA